MMPSAFYVFRQQPGASASLERRLPEGAELSIGTHKAIASHAAVSQGFVEPQSINFLAA